MLLLTGATGFVGGYLLEALLNEGLQVRCLVRPGSPRRSRLDPRAEIAEGDILDRASLSRALAGVETVIHLVGIIQESGSATFEAIHTLGTKNMVDMAMDSGVRKFIHMSALGTRPSAPSRYHRTKWQAEHYLRSSSIPCTIFRPAIIFGRGDGFFTTLTDLIRRMPVVPIIGSGQYQLQPVFIGDVVFCFVQAAKKPEEVQGVFELGGPERYTFNEIVAIVSESLGIVKGQVHVPVKVMMLLARLMGIFMKRPPVTTDQLLMLEEGNVCDLERMLTVFPLKLTRLRDGLATYIRQAGSTH